jgi:hypothetical protein
MSKPIVIPARMYTALGLLEDCIAVIDVENNYYEIIRIEYGEHIPIKYNDEYIYICIFPDDMTNVKAIRTGFVAYNIKPFLEIGGLSICFVKMYGWIEFYDPVKGIRKAIIEAKKKMSEEEKISVEPDSYIIWKVRGRVKSIMPMKTVGKRTVKRMIEELTNTFMLEAIGKVI